MCSFGCLGRGHVCGLVCVQVCVCMVWWVLSCVRACVHRHVCSVYKYAIILFHTWVGDKPKVRHVWPLSLFLHCPQLCMCKSRMSNLAINYTFKVQCRISNVKSQENATMAKKPLHSGIFRLVRWTLSISKVNFHVENLCQYKQCVCGTGGGVSLAGVSKLCL